MQKFTFSKLQAFQNTYFTEHVSAAALKPIQGILLIILKLLKSSTKFSLLDPGDEVWCKELSNISIFVDIWLPLFFKKKLISLLKPFKWCITLPLGVINTLVYGGWGSNLNTCPNMVNEVKKCQTHFLHFWTSELRKIIKILL